MNQFKTKPEKKPKRAKKTGSTTPRETLLKSASKLFAIKGLRGTSIRDISKLAKVNSSMISYYFGSKEDLYTECVKQIGESKLNLVKQILTPPLNKTEYQLKLKLFAENILNLFLEERESGLIIMREFDRAHSPAGPAFKSTFLNIFDLLLKFLENAQANNFMTKKQDPYFLTTVFFGTLIHQMRMDHIVEKKYHRSLKDTKNRQLLEEELIELLT